MRTLFTEHKSMMTPTTQDSAGCFRTEINRSYTTSFASLLSMFVILVIGVIGLCFEVNLRRNVLARATLGHTTLLDFLDGIAQVLGTEGSRTEDDPSPPGTITVIRMKELKAALVKARDDGKSSSSSAGETLFASCDQFLEEWSRKNTPSVGLTFDDPLSRLSVSTLAAQCSVEATASVMAVQSKVTTPTIRNRLIWSVYTSWMIHTQKTLLYLRGIEADPIRYRSDSRALATLTRTMDASRLLDVWLRNVLDLHGLKEVEEEVGRVFNITDHVYNIVQQRYPINALRIERAAASSAQDAAFSSKSFYTSEFSPHAPIELSLYVMGMVVCIGAFLAVHHVVRTYTSRVAPWRQLAQDFTASETTKHMLDVYRKAFSNLNLQEAEECPYGMSHGKVLVYVYRRVLTVVRDVKCFLPQTLFGGSSDLSTAKLRADSTITFREDTAVLTIRVALARRADPSESDSSSTQGILEAEYNEVVYSETIDVIQRTVSSSNGLIHSIVGSTIVAVWNMSIPVLNAATIAVRAAQQITEELCQMDELGTIAIGISSGPGVLSNIKTRRKRHVALICGASLMCERLLEVALHFEELIVFDASIYAALPRGGLGEDVYRPVCVIPIHQCTEYETVVYTLVPSAWMHRDQIKSFLNVFSLYREKEYGTFAQEMQKYIATYRKDRIAERLLETLEENAQ